MERLPAGREVQLRIAWSSVSAARTDLSVAWGLDSVARRDLQEGSRFREHQTGSGDATLHTSREAITEGLENVNPYAMQVMGMRLDGRARGHASKRFWGSCVAGIGSGPAGQKSDTDQRDHRNPSHRRGGYGHSPLTFCVDASYIPQQPAASERRVLPARGAFGRRNSPRQVGFIVPGITIPSRPTGSGHDSRRGWVFTIPEVAIMRLAFFLG